MLTPQFVLVLSAKLVMVRIKGEPWVTVDICLRMLTPRELANVTSFPPQHIIERGHDGRVFAKPKQVAMIGNAVPPLMQYAITAANYSEVDMRKAATAGSSAVVSNLISAAKRAGFIEFDEAPQSPSHLRIWLKEPKKNTAQLDFQYESVEEKSRDKYQQTLREQNMGAFPNFREDVYEQMQLLLSGDEKLSVGNFVRKAVQTVAQKHSAEHKKFSFASLQNFVMTLLKNAPVMKSETGELLMPSFSHMSHMVHSLADNWKEKLDGQIIVCLLKNGCAISMYDLPALTGAMYPTRDGDNQDKVQKVIELLKADDKITYGDDDSLVLVG